VNDLEDRLRSRLAALADTVESAELGDAVVAVGRRWRRRRTTAAAGLTAVVVASVVVGAVALATGGGDARGPRPVTALPTAVPSGDSTTIPDSAFRVAPPELQVMHGGPALEHPPCRSADVTAVAELRRAADSVVGVVSMRAEGCSLYVDPGLTELLDARGRRLALHLDAQPLAVNPPLNPRPELSLATGVGAWGFAWPGSWCGARAASAVMSLRDGRLPTSHALDRLVVPLHGSQPECSGRSDAVLVAGVLGRPDQPVLPAVRAWGELRATLSVPPAAAYNGVVDHLVATIRNPSDRPVALDPCPVFAVMTVSADTAGTEFDSGEGGLVCSGGDVVPAHGEIQLALAPQHYGGGSPLGHGGTASGGAVTVQFAMAGVPTASATTTVR
jgi:hypothetical protein